MKKTLVEKYVEDLEHMRLFQQERSIYEVTAMLEALLEAKGVTRAELAKRLGRTKGWVTQLLDGEANKTIRTVADVCAVLGQEYHSSHSPIDIDGGYASRLGVRARAFMEIHQLFLTGNPYDDPYAFVGQVQYILQQAACKGA